ncbi:hypothetical protein [Pedobacter cryoconitis]|uniref:Yip1 domain-containing protein n=1 Tax=Pedobacter cryoconitis TaxID=188932 RepID=A0A7X0MHC4_9SPHI|nr:hypothetical protein [Pedobacter cryoconitis]MBB6498979.1 hypothetical protein [Pedobacter cryoconitis]
MNYKLKSSHLYICLALLSIAITLIFNMLLVTKKVYFNTYSQFDNTRVEEMFDFQHKYIWIGYLLIPVWLLIKTFVVSLTLQIGTLIQGFKLKFSQTLRVALMAEFIFILPQIIKLFWFLVVQKEYTLIDLQQFYPLSALNFFSLKNLSVIFIYPFQTFNIFEVLYWITLAIGIRLELDKNVDLGIKVVFSGYIPALFLWILVIAFITVSISPLN